MVSSNRKVVKAEDCVLEDAAPPAPVKTRKPHKRQPDEVMARILEASTDAFTKDGFKGARLRSIAADAGITIQLLIYHVKTKDQLWRLVMQHMLTQYENRENKAEHLSADASAAERLQYAIADMIQFMAEHPALHRIMTQEGSHLSPRLTWLSERFIRPGIDLFTGLVRDAQREGAVRSDFDPLRLRYAVIAMASVPFSVAAEYEYFAGKSPFSRGEIQKTIDIVRKMVFQKQ